MSAPRGYTARSFEEKRVASERRIARAAPTIAHRYKCQHCGVQLTAQDALGHVARCPRSPGR